MKITPVQKYMKWPLFFAGLMSVAFMLVGMMGSMQLYGFYACRGLLYMFIFTVIVFIITVDHCITFLGEK
jgi:hypothetical protein